MTGADGMMNRDNWFEKNIKQVNNQRMIADSRAARTFVGSSPKTPPMPADTSACMWI